MTDPSRPPTTLANGLRVISEAMPRVADRWPWASGSMSAPATSRPRSTASPTCSSTWRSRAPPAAPPAPSPRRSSASAAASTPTPRASTPPTTPASWPATCRWPPNPVPTSSSNSTFDPDRAGEGAPRRPAGDRAGQGHARRPRLRPAAGGVLPRPADGPLDPGPGRDRGLDAARGAARLHAPPLRAEPARRRRRRQGRARPAGRPGRGRLFGGLPAAEAADPPRRPATRAATSSTSGRTWSRSISAPASRPALHHPDHFALQVLSTALGGGMSSRLFQEARENRGLCYSISTFASAYADTGQLGVYAGTAADDVPELPRS